MSADQTFTAILEWCRANAPQTAAMFAPPATPDDISQAEAATGITWPEDLKAIYRMANGESDWDVYPGSLFGSYSLMSLEQILQARTMSIEIRGQFFDTEPDSQAGEESLAYSPSFLPFASWDADYLLIDLRPGPMTGCIIAWDKVDGAADNVAWESLDALMSNLFDSLTGSAEFRWDRPVITDGKLEWE